MDDPSGDRRQQSDLLAGGGLRGPDTTVGRSQSAEQPEGQGHQGSDSRLDEEDSYSSDEEPILGRSTSDLSSGNTSEDVELDDLPSEDDGDDDEETGLTAKERRKRKRRKLKRRRLDERIAGDLKVTTEEEREADKNVIKQLVINAILIGLWYTFSLSISIYNTWMFSKQHLDFHFPLFTTSMHMLVQFTLSSLVLYFLPQFRPRSDSLNTHHRVQPPPSEHSEKKPLMSGWFYVSRIGPCGIATGLDIGLGNMSLKYITLAFYTMCKSSSLAFVLIFAFLFRLETPSIKLVLIIATMTVGVIMMVAGEAAFNALGFFLIISAAFFSGFRWALTQILLLRNPATSNPFSSIFFLAPIMFLSLLTIAIPVEGPGLLWERFSQLVGVYGVILGPAMLIFPGVIAFLMTASEFALLQRTSVVTLSICGIFKEVITISAAAIVFKDPLTPINLSGLIVTIISIAAYNYIKITKMRKDAVIETVIAHHRGEHHHLQGSDGGSGARGGYAPVENEPLFDAEAVEQEQTNDRGERSSSVERSTPAADATHPSHGS